MEKEKNPGGNLSNSEIEKEMARKKATGTDGRSYIGAQDTGDQKVREAGTEEKGDESDSDDGGLGPRGTSSMG